MLESYTKWSASGGPEEDFVNTGDNEVSRSFGRARLQFFFDGDRFLFSQGGYREFVDTGDVEVWRSFCMYIHI